MGMKIPLQPQATKTADFVTGAFEVPDDVDAIVATIVTSAMAGTSTPTLTATVQHSVDKVNWATLKAFTAKTSNTAETIVIAEQRDQASPVVIGPYIRVSATITGTTPSFGVLINAYAKQSHAR